MTSNSRNAFEEIVNELTRCGDSRTWSIIVTIFGDLAQNPADEISGPLLLMLTQSIGIKPQAMRVALHRLRRDGWLVTEKSGRTSKHRLSEYGLDQSASASPRIYARTLSMPDTWHMLVASPETQNAQKELESRGYRRVLPSVYIGMGSAPDDTPEYLTLEGRLSAIPEWLQTSIANKATIGEYSQLAQNLGIVKGFLENGCTPTPIETAVIRTLIVHNWRKIVLRQPDLSVEFLSKHPTTECRALVWELLESLEHPSIEELITAACQK